MAKLEWPISWLRFFRVNDIISSSRPLSGWTKSEPKSSLNSILKPLSVFPITHGWFQTVELLNRWLVYNFDLCKYFPSDFHAWGHCLFVNFTLKTYKITNPCLLFLLRDSQAQFTAIKPPHDFWLSIHSFIFAFSVLCLLSLGLRSLPSLGVPQTSCPTSRSVHYSHRVPSRCNSHNGGSSRGLGVFHPSGTLPFALNSHVLPRVGAPLPSPAWLVPSSPTRPKA